MIRLFAATGTVLALAACAAPLSTHPVEPADLGAPTSASAMMAALRDPGVATFEAIVAADWVFDHPSYSVSRAEETGDYGFYTFPLEGRVFFYAVRHPTRGLFLIDVGLPADGMAPHLGVMARAVVKPDENVTLRTTTSAWLDGERPDGVFITHLHFDHILGLRDLPTDVPIYIGGGDGAASHWTYRFTGGATRAALRGRPPLREWPTDPDPDGRLPGIVDVLGDGSVFAIRAPGHTPGSTAYLVNAADGVHLVTGDAVQSRAAWTGERVEMNTVEEHFEESRATREALIALAAEIPDVHVHLGHQSVEEP